MARISEAKKEQVRVHVGNWAEHYRNKSVAWIRSEVERQMGFPIGPVMGKYCQEWSDGGGPVEPDTELREEVLSTLKEPTPTISHAPAEPMIPEPNPGEQIVSIPTTSLDFVAYLSLHGINYTKVTEDHESIGRPGWTVYRFEYYIENSVFNKMRQRMIKGPIGKFLSMRKYLKEMLKNQMFAKERGGHNVWS